MRRTGRRRKISPISIDGKGRKHDARGSQAAAPGYDHRDDSDDNRGRGVCRPCLGWLGICRSRLGGLAERGRPTLNGGWPPFNRCPVDSPTMLASDGLKELAACLAESSPSGSVKIGNLSVVTKASNHQFAFVLNQETEESEVIAPPGGALRDEPVQLPGGLRELMCPNSGYVAWHVCRHAHDRGWDNRSNAVTLTLESAGTPSNFNLFAALFPGVPFASIPVKVHLQNEPLGDDCYIGTDAEPIVLQSANLAEPAGAIELFDTDGTPDEKGAMLRLGFLNTSEGARLLCCSSGQRLWAQGLLRSSHQQQGWLALPRRRCKQRGVRQCLQLSDSTRSECRS